MSARLALALATFIVVGACATPSEVPTVVQGDAASVVQDAYRDALRGGERVYAIDPKASVVVVEVRRAGSLAHLGHDHVVASRDLEGFVVPGRGRAEVRVPLDRLVVDDPVLRDEAGFTTQPSPSDIDGTRANMMGPVLQVERFPDALVHIEASPEGRADATVTLHGVSRRETFPLAVATGPDALTASGRLVLKQSDYAIAPFSILGGAIRVDDALVVRIRVRAIRVAG